jgi:hypothetical protein
MAQRYEKKTKQQTLLRLFLKIVSEEFLSQGLGQKLTLPYCTIRQGYFRIRAEYWEIRAAY